MRAEADAPWAHERSGTAVPLRFGRKASQPPRPTKCEARPTSAKDVGILAMTLSVIANSRLRTVLPTIHFVDALEYQKTSPQAVGQITNPHPQALSILSYLQKIKKF